MPTNHQSLDLDKTGININNKITMEPHTLSNRSVRSIAPREGPFFGESAQVYSGATLLQRGIHYQFAELHQEATLLFGKEIWSVVLIIDQTLPSQAFVTYQALGGLYKYSDSAVGNLYESVMNDARPIDYATGIINKPYEFTPTNHRHLLDDIFGFEPVVDYLERIKRAITLGQADVLLAVLRALAGRFECGELSKNKPSTKFVQYDALLYFLSRRKILSKTWIDTRSCKWYKGDSATFEIDTTDYPVGTRLYWELYVPVGQIALFTTKNGYIDCDGTVMQVNIYVPSEANVNNELLYIGVKEDPSDLDYKAVTYTINVMEHKTTNAAQGFLVNMAVEPNNVETTISLMADNNERRLYYQLQYN